MSKYAKKKQPGRVWLTLFVAAGYLCTMSVAALVTDSVNLRERQAVTIAQAQLRSDVNAEAGDQLRQESALLAKQLSSRQAKDASEAHALALAEAKKKAEAEAAAKAKAVYVPRLTGEFMAADYNGQTGYGQIDRWRNVNSDVIGYLKIPGTNISHPVLQNTQDVNYYTPLNVYKQKSRNGCIWTNPATTPGCDNTVLYGHNWTNCSANPGILRSWDVMFAQLTSYHHLVMAKSYPYLYYSTPGNDDTYVIFACFYTEANVANAFYYNKTSGSNDYIISEARKRSRHNFDVDVSASDQLVTLSTCTRAYGQHANQRFVVMARKLRAGETIGPVTVTANPNFKRPVL